MHDMNRRSFLHGAAALTTLIGSGCGGGAARFAGDGASDVARPAAGAGRISAPGGELWYEVVGDGPGIPLLVIHGGPGSTHDYMRSLAALSGDRPVIFYDQLDCGQSDKPNDPANWRVGRFVAEIESVRRELGLTRFHLLGHSWGGLLAAEYATSNTRFVAGCVLASPFISARRWAEDTRRWRRLLPNDVQATLTRHEAAGTLTDPGYQAALEIFYRRHLCRLDPWPDVLTRSLQASNYRLYVSMWGESEFRLTGTLRDHDASSAISQIDVPTLFTCGEFDEVAPVTVVGYSKLAANSQVRVFADASHVPHLEQTDAYNQALKVFLNEIG